MSLLLGPGFGRSKCRNSLSNNDLKVKSVCLASVVTACQSSPL
jgi:hypothetical protein